MEIKITKIDNKFQYNLVDQMEILEKIRLANFIEMQQFLHTLQIPLRTYQRLLKKGCTRKVKIAKSIYNFIQDNT